MLGAIGCDVECCMLLLGCAVEYYVSQDVPKPIFTLCFCHRKIRLSYCATYSSTNYCVHYTIKFPHQLAINELYAEFTLSII